MRTVVAIFLLLLVTGYAACHLPIVADSAAAKHNADDSWRRTVDGWERTTWTPTPRDDRVYSLPHPALLAVGEVLLSLAAMLAWSAEKVGQALAGRKSLPSTAVCQAKA